MPQQPRQIRTDERVFICGKTGSGKTTLAKWLTAKIRRLIVLDSKGTLSSWGLTDFDNKAKSALVHGEACRARALAPIGDDIDTSAFWNDVFRFAFEAGNVTLYIDELFAIVEPGQRPPAYLSACYTRGREFGVGVWASTQRPSWVPLFTMSEAEHYFMFRMNLAKDRATMAAFMTEQVYQPIKDPHGFYYMAAADDSPQYFRQFDIASKAAAVTSNNGTAPKDKITEVASEAR